MYRQVLSRYLVALFILTIMGLMLAAPLLTQTASASMNNDAGMSLAKKGGGGKPGTPPPDGDPLACQRNNPERLDCSSLEVTGVCEGPVAVFTITNTGEAGAGDMRAATEYRILQGGVVVETGTVLLAGGDSLEIRYEGSGTIELQADQQIGHPGNSRPRVSLNCGGSDPTPTPDPTETPPPDPTEDPVTVTLEAFCSEDGVPAFAITNGPVAMSEPVPYSVTNADGDVIASGFVQLGANDTTVLEFPEYAYQTLTLTILDQRITAGCEPPAPTVTVESFCADGGVPVFTIYNGAVPMLLPVWYQVTDADGNVVDEGYLQLGAHEGFYLEYPDHAFATLTLTILDRVVTSDCAAPPPVVYLDASCTDAGVPVFSITNGDVPMVEPVWYQVTDAAGNVVDEGYILLGAYESLTLEYPGYTALTLTILGLSTTTVCAPPAPEVTVDAFCTDDRTPAFLINNGAVPMTAPVYYVVTNAAGTVVDEGYVQLATYTSAFLSYPGHTTLTLTILGVSATTTCELPPPPPPPPTEPPGCQRNNPERPDCSSLEVTATCEGSTAVFTIYNGGEPGEGDMVAATQYRIYVNSTLVESGTVLLAGGTSMEIRYLSDGQRVTLEADQQVGHPGHSQPQATLTCGG